MLGTLLDASNTKIKIKTKQNRNKTHFLSNPLPSTCHLRQIGLSQEAGPQGFSTRECVGLALLSPNLHLCPSRLTSMYPFSKFCNSHMPEQLRHLLYLILDEAPEKVRGAVLAN